MSPPGGDGRSIVSRRSVLAGVAGVGIGVTPGCLGVLPAPDTSEPVYPGGTLRIQHTGSSPLAVHVEVLESGYSAEYDAELDAGAIVVREAFVTAEEGTVVTLAARLGPDGDPTTFEFLPGGGVETPPEVAILTVENEVEASAIWKATAGYAPDGD